MRLTFRIDLSSIAPCTALCAVIALHVLPVGVNAQEAAQAQSTTLAAALSAETTASTATEIREFASDVLGIPADAASVNDISLNGQVLSRQRGGAVGMVMAAATPQLTRGNVGGRSVTLWDEIAPPSPLPVPIDAARAAQDNVSHYQGESSRTG